MLYPEGSGNLMIQKLIYHNSEMLLWLREFPNFLVRLTRSVAMQCVANKGALSGSYL